MVLPDLRTCITLPDYHPHCEICGCRAELVSDFTHTNYRGAIYDCYSGDVTHRFIDREDEYFSIDYWTLNQKERGIYERLSAAERRVFLSMDQEEKAVFLKFTKKVRNAYLLSTHKSVIDEYENFLSSEFIKYSVYE